jgi:hypothetical protein
LAFGVVSVALGGVRACLLSLVPSGFHAVNLRHFPKFTAFFGPNHRDL